MRIKANQRSILILFLAALVMQVLDPSPVWKALLVVFGGMWLTGRFWAYSLGKNLQIVREIRFGWVQVGDKLEEQFQLSNHGIIPASWVQIVDDSTLPGYSASRVTSADPKDTSQWKTGGVCTRRGVFRLGGTRLRSGDPLGMFTVEIEQPAQQTLVVLPPVIHLPGVEVLPAGLWAGDGRAQHNKAGESVSAATVREYLHGMPLKKIHWPTSARHGKLYARLEEGAPPNEWMILLDADENIQAGHDADSTLELGIIAAASLIDRGLRAGFPTGLFASGSDSAWIKPGSGEDHRLRLMRELAVLQAGRQPFHEVIERAGPAIRQNSSLVLITSSLDETWAAALTRLMRKGIRPTVLLMDASTFGGEKDADAFCGLLANLGVQRFLLTRDLLHQPAAKPGGRGQWQWRISPTGRAIPVHPVGDMTWKKLG